MNDTATPTPAKAKATRLYKVKDRVTGDVIYVNATSRNMADNFASYRRFETTILTIKEAIGLKSEDILDATVEKGPPVQVNLPE